MNVIAPEHLGSRSSLFLLQYNTSHIGIFEVRQGSRFEFHGIQPSGGRQGEETTRERVQLMVQFLCSDNHMYS